MASMGDFSATGRWSGARLSGAMAALFLAAAIGVDARAALYTCIDASGQKQYFTTPRGAGCEERPSYESGAESPPPAVAAPPRASSVAPPRAPSAAPSSSKKKYPRVSAKTQSERDLARREILLRELRREQTLQEAMAHVALAAEEAGDSRRADLFGARIRRHAVNIRAIQNELARLP